MMRRISGGRRSFKGAFVSEASSGMDLHRRRRRRRCDGLQK
jgi:hypothetical protein